MKYSYYISIPLDICRNGKLEVYRKNGLKFIIIKPKDAVDKIMEDIKNGKYNTPEITATQ